MNPLHQLGLAFFVVATAVGCSSASSQDATAGLSASKPPTSSAVEASLVRSYLPSSAGIHFSAEVEPAGRGAIKVTVHAENRGTRAWVHPWFEPRFGCEASAWPVSIAGEDPAHIETSCPLRPAVADVELGVGQSMVVAEVRIPRDHVPHGAVSVVVESREGAAELVVRHAYDHCQPVALCVVEGTVDAWRLGFDAASPPARADALLEPAS